MPLSDALALFRRLGVNVESMNQRDFATSYFVLAKRYHPDRNPRSAELMANINAQQLAEIGPRMRQKPFGRSFCYESFENTKSHTA
jgi:curved DNA-binding protein CbpA